jgi:hypothetical protein
MKVWDPAAGPKPITVETTPLGKRISDGIIWAYEASGFYRVPPDDVVWSRSMIEESGGCLVDDGELDPEPSPSCLIPWLSRQSISHDVNDTVTTSVCDKMSVGDTGASHALPLAEVCHMNEFLSSKSLIFGFLVSERGPMWSPFSRRHYETPSSRNPPHQ